MQRVVAARKCKASTRRWWCKPWRDNAHEYQTGEASTLFYDLLDQEEQDILNSFNRGEWVSKNESLDKYKEAAKKTFAKTHRINFRVSERDFRGIL